MSALSTPGWKLPDGPAAGDKETANEDGHQGLMEAAAKICGKKGANGVANGQPQVRHQARPPQNGTAMICGKRQVNTEYMRKLSTWLMFGKPIPLKVQVKLKGC